MNSPLTRVKVPISLYKKANQAKILNVVKFYYRVKSLSIQGCYSNSKFIQICMDSLNVSYNTAKKYKTLLLKNKFAYLKQDHFYLISYDSLWEKLNVEKFNDRYKIIYTQFHEIDQKVYLEEIKYNLKRQKKKLQEKYLKQELKADTVINANKRLKKALISNMGTFMSEKLMIGFNSIRKNLSSLLEINFQITLTCKKVADLLGYKSAIQGHSIIHQLRYKGLLTSTLQRPLFIAKNVSQKIFRSLNLDSSFFLTTNNILLKRLPNLIKLI